MDDEVRRKLRYVSREWLGEINAMDSVGKIGYRMMTIEMELGAGETLDAKENGVDWDYVLALDSLWGEICEGGLNRIFEIGFDPEPYDLDRVERDLYDNYFGAAAAAVAAIRVEPAVKELPLLAWVAFNKHTYVGMADEIGILRTLLWAGYDPNAQDEDGMTALHYMASTKHGSVSHPRAVRLLLQAGADPNIQNIRGDSPLCYMSGNQRWTQDLHNSARKLLRAGADPSLAANDGATALSLQMANSNDPHREAIIKLMKKALVGRAQA